MEKLYELKGKKIIHPKFGNGVIKDVNITEKDEFYVYIYVDFNGVSKKFGITSLGKFFNIEDDTYDYLKYLNDLNVNKRIQNQIKERKTFLEKNNINYLVHFTKLENIDSIIENGLLSINNLYKRNIKFNKTDNERLDNQLDYICTSITFPNYRMFYQKREQNHSQSWCVIKIHIRIIFYKMDTLFLPSNAADKDLSELFKTYESKLQFQSNESLFALFNKSINLRNQKKIRQTDLINDNMTTNPQAEVLIKDSIKKEYIASIVVENEAIKNVLYKRYSNIINIEVNPKYFEPRKDYEYWRLKNYDNTTYFYNN